MVGSVMADCHPFESTHTAERLTVAETHQPGEVTPDNDPDKNNAGRAAGRASIVVRGAARSLLLFLNSTLRALSSSMIVQSA